MLYWRRGGDYRHASARNPDRWPARDRSGGGTRRRHMPAAACGAYPRRAAFAFFEGSHDCAARSSTTESSWSAEPRGLGACGARWWGRRSGTSKRSPPRAATARPRGGALTPAHGVSAAGVMLAPAIALAVFKRGLRCLANDGPSGPRPASMLHRRATGLGGYRACRCTCEHCPYESLPPLDSSRFAGAFQWPGDAGGLVPEQDTKLNGVAGDPAARGLTLPQDFVTFRTGAHVRAYIRPARRCGGRRPQSVRDRGIPPSSARRSASRWWPRRRRRR